MQISSSPYPYLSREHIASEMGFKFNDINEILSNDMGYGMSFPKYARLDRKAQAAAYDRHIYPLSGFTKGDEAKVTIIGKLRGYDPDFTSEQLSDLKNFINESKGLFVEYIQGQQAKPDNDKPKILRDTPYTVNEFLNEYRGNRQLLFMQNSRTVDLLDSDMSVDEFKEEWAKYALKERFNITLSGEDAKNAVNILKEMNEKGIHYTFGASMARSDSAVRTINQEVYASVDIDFLREAVNNLVENAIKYTASGGGIWVNVRGDDDRVLINVTDTGIGISPDDLKHVFQKFYRADNSQTRTVGGTGLGLYLVKQRVEAMGGKVWAESSFGEGSTFYLSFPRITAEEYQRRKQIASNIEAMNINTPINGINNNDMNGDNLTQANMTNSASPPVQENLVANPIVPNEPIQQNIQARQFQTTIAQPTQVAQPQIPQMQTSTLPPQTNQSQTMQVQTQPSLAQSPTPQPPVMQPAATPTSAAQMTTPQASVTQPVAAPTSTAQMTTPQAPVMQPQVTQTSVMQLQATQTPIIQQQNLTPQPPQQPINNNQALPTNN